MKKSSSLGMEYTIVTSAYWVNSYEETFAKMKLLKDLGLDRINISCDPGHQRKIPISNVKMLADISNEVGLRVYIVGTFNDASMNIETYLKKNNIEFDEKINLSTKIIAPFGKAKNANATMEAYGLTVDYSELHCCRYGFDISVWPNGDIYPCCSTANIDSPLIMGNLRKDDFKEVITKTLGNVFFRVIKRESFQGLIDICEKYNCSITHLLPEKHEISGPCGLCLKLMKNPETKGLIKKAISLYEIDLIYEILDTYVDENSWA